MAEPASSTAGIAIAAGTVTLTGSILGIHYDALLGGFFGGLISLSYLPPMPPLRIAGTVASSALLAGVFAPIAAAAGINYLPWLIAVGGDFSRIAASVVIGVVWQAVLPAALNKLRAMLGTPGGVQ